MIMVRTLRRDIARYNAGESDSLAGLDETIEETGWKLVHGDVFRPPINSRLFAAVIGSGIQIFFMALITICRVVLTFFFFFQRLLAESPSSTDLCTHFVFRSRSLRDAGDAVAGESRGLGHLRYIFIRVFRPGRRLLLRAIVQNDAGPRVEEGRLAGEDNADIYWKLFSFICLCVIFVSHPRTRWGWCLRVHLGEITDGR